jgi:hypothetical protein
MRALNCYWEEEDGGGDDDEEFVNLFGVKIRAGSVEAINRKVEMHTRRMEIQQRGRGEGKEVRRRARSTVNGPHEIKIPMYWLGLLPPCILSLLVLGRFFLHEPGFSTFNFKKCSKRAKSFRIIYAPSSPPDIMALVLVHG